MIMLVGLTVSFVVSLLLRVMKTPPDGAGFASVTSIHSRSPGAIVNPDGRIMSRPVFTVTLAEAPVTFGAVAVMVEEPAPTPVTGTFALVALALNVTLGGTVTAPVLLDIKVTVNPFAGAGVERFN